MVEEPYLVNKECDKIIGFALYVQDLQLETHIVHDWDEPFDTKPWSLQQITKIKWKGKGTTPTITDMKPSSNLHTGSLH